jgi:hypothetical protein
LNQSIFKEKSNLVAGATVRKGQPSGNSHTQKEATTFHEWPELWLYRIHALRNSNFDLTMTIDTDVQTCFGWYEILKGLSATRFDVITSTAVHPHAEGELDKDVVPLSFPERNLGFVVFNTTAPAVQHLLARYENVYVSQALDSSLWIKGDQAAFRQALWEQQSLNQSFIPLKEHMLPLNLGCRFDGVCADGCLFVHRHFRVDNEPGMRPSPVHMSNPIWTENGMEFTSASRFEPKVAPQTPTLPPRVGILVVGPSRSGTSTVAMLLSKLFGVFSPQRSLGVLDAAHPSGIYELDEVVRWNEQLMNKGGTPFDGRSSATNMSSTPLFGIPVYSAAFEKFKAIAPRLLQKWIQEEGAHGKYKNVWLIKDPRLCWTAHMWAKALSTENVLVVMVGRSPLSTAKSLVRNGGWKDPYQRWEKMVRAMLNSTSSLNRTIVHYSDIMHDPAGSVLRLRAALERIGASGLLELDPDPSRPVAAFGEDLLFHSDEPPTYSQDSLVVGAGGFGSGLTEKQVRLAEILQMLP